MSLSSLAIDADEWDTVASLASRLQPNETANAPGVALAEERGHRRWSIRTPWLHVDIPGGDGTAPLLGTVWLPTRLVIHAAELAAAEGTCNLIVGNQSATIVNSAGNAHFGLAEFVPPPTQPRPRQINGSVVADLTVGQLLHVLRSTRRVPSGVDLSATTAPDVWLGIEEGYVAATVAWSHFGAPQVTVRTPATTTGTGTVRIPHFDVALLLDSFHPDAVVRLDVDDAHHVLWLDGHHWTAAVALTQMPGVPTVDPPTITIDDAFDGLATRTQPGAPWHIDIAGTHVTITEPVGAETVRATVRLADRVQPTPDVLAELNAINRGLAALRVWVDDLVLYAGIDHPRRHLTDLPDAIRGLVADTADIGPMIAMLGVPEPAPRTDPVEPPRDNADNSDQPPC